MPNLFNPTDAKLFIPREAYQIDWNEINGSKTERYLLLELDANNKQFNLRQIVCGNPYDNCRIRLDEPINVHNAVPYLTGGHLPVIIGTSGAFA